MLLHSFFQEQVPILTQITTLTTRNLTIPLLRGGVNDANNLLWQLIVLVMLQTMRRLFAANTGDDDNRDPDYNPLEEEPTPVPVPVPRSPRQVN